ncbi:MAG TPA: choice-of-anchor Q domain-containing protein [Flavisolibacter sp.]|nr:choice-of-anchor Q domain-containing protein [Flavisolibacter sp.]
MNISTKVVLLSLLMNIGLMTGSSIRVLAQIKLTPKADGYIYLAGEKMNKAYGTGDSLLTRYTKRGETTTHTYIRFDLSPQPGSFKKVTFHIYGRSDKAKLVDVFSAFGEWTEATLKGSEGGKPSRANFLGSFDVSPVEKYSQVDITPYMNYVKSVGKNDITLVLVEREQQADANVSYFHSAQNSSGKAPFLQLESGKAPVNTPGSVYYVDAKNGNDLASGKSPGTAWKTLKKVESVFLQAGDKVLFKRGNIFKGSLFLKIIPSSKAITRIGAYGKGEKPVLDAEGKESFSLMLFNTPYIEVEDLTITQTAKDIPSIRRGIYYQAEDRGEVNHVRFKNINFQNMVGNKGKEDGDLFAKRNAGLSLEITGNNTPTYLNGYLIEGCRFYRVGRHGAVNQSSWSKRTLTTNTNWVPSKNVVIRNNIFEETSSDGLIVRVADGPLMEYNLFKRCSNELSGNASFTFNCDNALWQYNEACYTVYNTGDLDAAGFDSDFKSKNTIFQFNYAHHNEYGDMLITGGPSNFGGFNDGTIVRYNVFYNNGHHGIRLSGGATNTSIYNNIIYKDQNVATPTEPYVEFLSNRLFYTKNWGGWPKDAMYANNIYYYNHDSIPASSDLNANESPGSVFFNNLIYANKMVNYPEQDNGIRSNPLLKLPKNNKNWEGLMNMLHFQLQKGSPAVDAGRHVEGTITNDFNGTSIPQNGKTDIGAFESKVESSGK